MDCELREVMVMYKDSTKILKFSDPSKLPKIMVDAFQIVGVDVMVQYYDKKWDSWVDLDDFQMLENLMKLRMLDLICDMLESTPKTLETG